MDAIEWVRKEEAMKIQTSVQPNRAELRPNWLGIEPIGIRLNVRANVGPRNDIPQESMLILEPNA